MNRSDDEVLLLAVGDVFPDRPDPAQAFVLVRDAMRRADIAFCQLEANLTEGGTRLPQARHAVRGDPRIADALRDTGFNVVSFAGNHCLDYGREAFLETIERVSGTGAAIVGAGATIDDARRPAIVESKGNRVGFLAYSSILPMGYWAEQDRAGCAPMRAWTIYEQIEHDQPGTPCRIHTFPHRDDLRAMCDDIRRLKAQADVVIVSLHWGIHFVPAVIADYQRDVAHAAIDAGADLILGHHAHILKGIEIYKDKPIFYSLCNFAVDLRMDAKHAASKGFREIQGLHPQWQPDFDSLYNFPPDSRKSMVVKCTIAERGVKSVSILPVHINSHAQPQILASDDPRFAEVIDYLDTISTHQGLATRFVSQGNEVFATPAPQDGDRS